MTIQITMWDKLSTYLFVDKKMSRSKKNYHCLRSRFVALQKYFADKDFDRDNFNDFIISLQDKSYTNAYINNLIKMAKHIDSFSGIKALQDYTYFREKRKDVRTLTPEEVDAISLVKLPYTAVNERLNTRDYVLIQFLYATAARIGEAENLRWDDVRNDPIPHVIFRDTKNGEDGIVPLSRRMYDLLFTLPQDNAYVFAGCWGNKLDVTALRNNLKRRAQLAGVDKDIYPHLFRHSKITYLSNVQNFPIAVVSKFARHKTLNTTMRYTHTTLLELSIMAYSSPMEDQKEVMHEKVNLGKHILENLFGKAYTVIPEKRNDNIFFTVQIIK